MPLFAIYLLKFSIGLGVVWSFYQLLLRRLTFYNWNRWYLLGYAVLAFFMPAVNVTGILENSTVGSTAIIRYIPMIADPKNLQLPAPAPVSTVGHFFGFASWNSWDLLLAIIVLGSVIFLIRFSTRGYPYGD